MTPILNRIAASLKKVSSLDFQKSTVKLRGASLQRIPGTKILAWDQARSDQAPHWGKKGKKNRRERKKKGYKGRKPTVGFAIFHFTQFLPFSLNAELGPRLLKFCQLLADFFFVYTYIHILLARPHRAFQSQCYSCNNFKHRNLKTRKIID